MVNQQHVRLVLVGLKFIYHTLVHTFAVNEVRLLSSSFFKVPLQVVCLVGYYSVVMTESLARLYGFYNQPFLDSHSSLIF